MPRCRGLWPAFAVRDDLQSLPEFVESMPPRYGWQICERAAAEHVRLVRQRRDQMVSVGAFPSPDREGYGLCVVADDAPGLLALISAALVLCSLDILEAEAYTRHSPHAKAEAVDLFWVRHAHPAESVPLNDADIAEFRETMEDLLSSNERPALSRRHPDSLTPSATETSIRFVEDNAGRVTTLEIETRDRSGLLLSVTEALFKESVQIVGSHIATRHGRVHDRFELVEFDGSPINKGRRHTLQLAVLAAVDRGGSAEVAVTHS